MNDDASFLGGVRSASPIVLGYLVIGLAFGLVARSEGLTPVEVGLMSLVLYAGSAQFVLVELWQSGTSVITVALTIFLVNLRHLLYSAALTPKLSQLSALRGLVVGAELTDETFAVASGRSSIPIPWMLGLNVAAQVTWLIATVGGALLGRAIPDGSTIGLDFALPAMFAALLVLQMLSVPHLRIVLMTVLIASVVSLVGALLAPDGAAIVTAGVVAATAGFVLERRLA